MDFHGIFVNVVRTGVFVGMANPECYILFVVWFVYKAIIYLLALYADIKCMLLASAALLCQILANTLSTFLSSAYCRFDNDRIVMG